MQRDKQLMNMLKLTQHVLLFYTAVMNVSHLSFSYLSYCISRLSET